MTDLIDRKCKHCRFAEESELDAESLKRNLVCRRFPPQIYAQMVQTGQGPAMAVTSIFPRVDPDLWCHEFAVKEIAH